MKFCGRSISRIFGILDGTAPAAEHPSRRRRPSRRSRARISSAIPLPSGPSPRPRESRPGRQGSFRRTAARPEFELAAFPGRADSRACRPCRGSKSRGTGGRDAGLRCAARPVRSRRRFRPALGFRRCSIRRILVAPRFPVPPACRRRRRRAGSVERGNPASTSDPSLPQEAVAEPVAHESGFPDFSMRLIYGGRRRNLLDAPFGLAHSASLRTSRLRFVDPTIRGRAPRLGKKEHCRLQGFGHRVVAKEISVRAKSLRIRIRIAEARS